MNEWMIIITIITIVEEGVQNALRQVKIDTQQYAKRYGE